jgi:predicted thioesterase
LLKGKLEELLTRRMKLDFVRVVSKPETTRNGPLGIIAEAAGARRILSSQWVLNRYENSSLYLILQPLPLHSWTITGGIVVTSAKSFVVGETTVKL